MKHDTAGDPMTGVKWTRRTTDKIACALRSLGVNVSSKTVGRLLRVRAHVIRRRYPKGVKITDARMQALSVTKDQTLPKWNYTIRPS